MTSQAKIEIAGGSPLILQADVVVAALEDDVVVLEVVVGVVEIFGVVLGAAGVVEIARVVEGAAGVVLGAAGVVLIARVVEGAAGVVDGAAGVVEGNFAVVDGAAGVVLSCRFFLYAFVQGAVTVTFVLAAVPVCVTVFVVSVIGTNEEQKADALSAMRMALQTSTLLRASRSARASSSAAPMTAAVTDAERSARAPRTTFEKCIFGASWVHSNLSE